MYVSKLKMRRLLSDNSIKNSVADPHHFDANPDADPDPAFHFCADPDPIFHFEADAEPTTHFLQISTLPMLQNEPLRLPPFHFAADPDSASQNDPDICGSGKL